MSQTATSVFVMRPTQEEDIPVLSMWMEDLDDLSLFDRSVRIPQNPKAAEAAWKDVISDASQKERLWFTIEDPDARPCGMIGLESISPVNGDAVLAMFMAREARNKGIGVRASALAIDIAFLQLRLHRLTSFYRDDNDISAYLVNQAGFQKEGLLRQAWYTKGQYVDTVAVGLLREEWVEKRAALAEKLSEETVVTFGRRTATSWSWPPIEDN